LSTEVARAEAAEADLSSDLSTEVARAEAAEADLSSDLSSEIVRATGVEDGLDSRISTLEDTIMEDNETYVTVLSGIATAANATEDYSLAHNVQDDNKDLVQVFINGVKAEVTAVNGTTATVVASYDVDSNDELVFIYQGA